MKIARLAIAGACLYASFVCCSMSYEGQGDAAYKKAQKSEGNEKRLLQKTAYINYKEAIKKHPDKMRPQLRDRFMEMTLVRANMVLSEGNYAMEAIPFFIEDMDKLAGADMSAELKDQYAAFLIALSDSNRVHDQMDTAMALLHKASTISSNSQAVSQQMDSAIIQFASGYFGMANTDYESGIKNNDTKALIRAEYYVKLAMLYAPELAGAADLLSNIYKKNINVYSAYKTVFDEKLNRKVDKYDIMMAIPAQIKTGAGIKLEVNMTNFSYNAVKLKPECFKLIDENGAVYQALPSSKLQPEIFDTQTETKLIIQFPNVKGPIKKLVFEFKEHVSEKNFY